ncbi:YkgJ family cysteine cluster protein [Thiovibrio sp. JS02]
MKNKSAKPGGKGPQRQCRQCGTCCRKGGPALRREDLELLRRGIVRHEQLVTIRKGEMGFNPAGNRLEPVPVELLKIRGQGGDWTCLFLDQANNSCAIYAHRPLTCALLECWQPAALFAAIYQDTLRRTDLINPDDPILEHIARHERQCPGEEWTALLGQYMESGAGALLARLNGLVRADLVLRQEIAARTGMTVDVEFFLLGRPFVTQLAGSGLVCVEEGGEICLRRGEGA